MKADND